MRKKSWPNVCLRWLGGLILNLLVWVVFSQTILRLAKRWVHFPAPPFLGRLLDSPVRRRLQPPDLVVSWMDLRPGMQVMEVGPGAGTFTEVAARSVGDGGKVHAFDIQPGMIAQVEARMQTRGVRNVDARVASAYDLPVPDGSMDRVFMVTVLPEIPDPQRALREFRRVLKPDGLLAVAEFLVDPDYPRLSTVVRWASDAGFKPAGSHRRGLHYVALFRP